MCASVFFGFSRRLLLGVGLASMLTGAATFAETLDRLPEASDAQMRRFAGFFDFDGDSCYPSSAIPTQVNGEVAINDGMSVTESDPSYVSGCREFKQLNNSNTYHRRTVIVKNGVTHSVRMDALYFMKDKSLPGLQTEVLGSAHRHVWEFALVWTTDDKLTHAYVSQHSGSDLKHFSELQFDFGAKFNI